MFLASHFICLHLPLLHLLDGDDDFYFSGILWDSREITCKKKKVLSTPLKYCEGTAVCPSGISWSLPGEPALTLLVATSLSLIWTTCCAFCLYLFVWLTGMFQVGTPIRLHIPWEQGMCTSATRSRTELSEYFWVCIRTQSTRAMFKLYIPYTAYCTGPPHGHRKATKKDKKRDFVER